MTNIRVAVDVGGTFTDICIMDDTTGELRVEKTASTPDDPMQGEAWVTERIPASTGLQKFMFAIGLDVNADGRTDIVSSGWMRMPRTWALVTPRNKSRLSGRVSAR